MAKFFLNSELILSNFCNKFDAFVPMKLKMVYLQEKILIFLNTQIKKLCSMLNFI